MVYDSIHFPAPLTFPLELPLEQFIMSLDHMGHMSSKNGCRLFSLLFGQSSIITLEVIKCYFFAPFLGGFFFNEEISFNREVERKLPLICRTHATSFPCKIVCSATKQVRRIATFYISYPQPSDGHSSRGTFSTHGPNRSVFILGVVRWCR